MVMEGSSLLVYISSFVYPSEPHTNQVLCTHMYPDLIKKEVIIDKSSIKQQERMLHSDTQAH